MADRGICDVMSGRTRLSVSRDANRSISGRVGAPLVAARRWFKPLVDMAGEAG